MAYSEFAQESANQLLDLTSCMAELFPDTRPAVAPAWLAETLARGGQSSHMATRSGKARSEFIVAFILLTARESSGDRFAIYSGQRLDVDQARGLAVECDFILTASEPILTLQAPIAVLVEAKKHDIEIGLGQCVAQMVAADLFDQAAGRPAGPIFGCVTTGETWQFLKLDGAVILLDRGRYYRTELSLIPAIFVDITSRQLKAA